MDISKTTLSQGKRTRWRVYVGLLIVLAILYSIRSFPLANDNGFDLSNTLVSRDEIFHGGPGRDGIPAIDKPHFVKGSEASFMRPIDRILGLLYDGVVRAYPIKIMNYHEIVNDRIKQQAIVISYCPLCGSGMAFKPEFNNSDNTFGVSGLLYNSDMLLYDRNTESLWSQLMATAISGKLKGKQLRSLVLTDTTWAAWLQQHPDTEVLSTRTGYSRDYDRHPYGAYDTNRGLYFPVRHTSARYHPKERVIGLTLGKRTRAWPVSELDKQHKAIIKDVFAGKSLTIKYDAASRSAVIYDAEQRPLATTNLFWFAWAAFHPDTEVYTATGKAVK